MFPVHYSQTCPDWHVVQVKYICGTPTTETELSHGTERGATAVIDLENDEYITGVEGYSATQSWIYQLTFVTNKRLLSLPVATGQENR